MHELGQSAPGWHKTPLSDIGYEGRANKVLLRLMCPNFKPIEKF